MSPRPLAFFCALLLAPAALGWHPDCVPTTSRPDFDTGRDAQPFAGRWYVENDCGFNTCGPDATGAFFIYEETNGIDGLQRQDEVFDDTCHGLIEGDSPRF